MSRKRSKGKVASVLKEARRHALPKMRHLHKIDVSSLPPLDNKKIKKRIQLQTALDKDPDIYDDAWIGDNMNTQDNTSIRFWFQNCNGLVHKSDIREFEYDIALMADKGVNYMSFSETCVNTNKAGYTHKLQDSYSHIITNGSIKLANSPKYPKRTCYQPGGVAAGYDGAMRTRFSKEGSVKYERWIWQEFGHGHMVTRVYTIYRVNHGSEIKSGSRTAWAQQKIL